MNTMESLILGAGIGALLGGVVIYLLQRARLSVEQAKLDSTQTQLTEKTQGLQDVELQLRSALEAKAGAEQQARRVPELERQLEDLRGTNTQLTAEVAELRKAQEADQEKIQWVEKAQQQLREAFQALAGETLKSNAEEFLKSARQQLDNIVTAMRGDWGTQKEQIQQLVNPLSDTLQTLDGQIRALEQKREGAYKGLDAQLQHLGQAQQQLHTATIKLEQALKSPTIRGSWGQVQLRRVMELAGMESHVAFDEQPTAQTGRPDLVVYLPNHAVLPVDAKAPMNAFLEAMESTDGETRKAKMRAHAEAVRARARELGQKKYWEQFERAPEFVVMFMPNDTCLSAAFEHDPDLLEFAFQQRVLLTTPVTLLALLKAVAYGWQQYQITENARQIAEQGKDLYERLAKFLEHIMKTGSGLDSAVRAYNEAVGSLESRLLPTARRFKELGAITTELPALEAIDRQTRQIAASEATALGQDRQLPEPTSDET